MELTNDPTPVPSVVQLPPTTGFAVVAQQTPLAVTVALPSVVTVPPEVAPEEVMPVTAAVVTAGAAANVVNCVSAP